MGVRLRLVLGFVKIECMKSGEYGKKRKSDSAHNIFHFLPSIDRE